MRYTSILLILMVVFSGGLLGQSQAFPEVNTKIAFINSTAILQGTAEGKQQLGTLEQFIAERRSRLETQNQELDQIKRQYNSQARMLNPATAAEMQKTITEKERSIRRLQEDMELEVTNRRNEVLNGMSAKIQEVVAEYAQANNYGVVFLENPNLPFYSPALDITASIIQAYDQKHPVAAAAGTSQTAPQNPAP